MDGDLARVANEHWRMFYRGLVDSFGGEWRRFGGVDAFSTPHVPAQFANGALVIEPATPDDLRAAIEWSRSGAAVYGVRIDTRLDSRLLEVPLETSMQREEPNLPGMVLMPIPAAPTPPLGVSAERVTQVNFEDFIQATVDNGFPRPLAEQAFNLAATTSGDLDFFLGRLDDRPVATATLVRTGDVCGIYAVATVEDARRRGLGAAVTWAAVSRAREWGMRGVVLQSSAMGLGVYSSIGFSRVVEYAVFAPPRVPVR